MRIHAAVIYLYSLSWLVPTPYLQSVSTYASNGSRGGSEGSLGPPLRPPAFKYPMKRYNMVSLRNEIKSEKQHICTCT